MAAATRRSTRSRGGPRQDPLEVVAGLLVRARSALFITGSGLSAESELPHYRGLPGLQRKRREDGKLFEAALDIATLQRKPMTTWKLLLDMDARVRAAKPNAGHDALVRFERHLERCTIMTTSVDRLHQRAGSKSVIEMHGALHDLRCATCEISTRHDRFDRLDIPPSCHTCGTTLRPDMPLFGEALPADPFTRLQAELEEGFDIVMAIGVVAMFPYLARPLLVAKAEGAPTVEIGSTNTDVSEVVDFRFKGSPRRILDALGVLYEQLRSGSRRGRK